MRFAIQGGIVMSATLSQNKTVLSIDHLEAGLYFVKTSTSTEKLIIE
ncbi:MAG: hypothetical protein ACJA0Q_002023 [Saprospiraceae bacterium]|jgi:hypothetical protein